MLIPRPPPMEAGVASGYLPDFLPEVFCHEPSSSMLPYSAIWDSCHTSLHMC